MSEYAKGMPEEMLRERLYPSLPPAGKPVFCFYPMTKRREAHANWYATPYERRDEMMREHGKTGRTFAGKVVQLITGSTGLDDFEWGVTLFALTPEVVKDVVYTMRFDTGLGALRRVRPLLRRLRRADRRGARRGRPLISARRRRVTPVRHVDARLVELERRRTGPAPDRRRQPICTVPPGPS